ADWLVWVQDGATAALLRWNGSAWEVDRALSAANFRHAANQLPPLTDLYLPFAWLGLTPGSAATLLALASEEGALQLWASAPDKNPLNSPRVVSALASERDLSAFDLTQFFTLPALGDG